MSYQFASRKYILYIKPVWWLVMTITGLIGTAAVIGRKRKMNK